MSTEIPNNDYRDWILFKGVDDDNFVFDISKHSNFINSLNEIEKARFDLALKEMLMNGTLFEHKKNKIFLLTSLGKAVSEEGTFSAYNPHISSELNINEQFSKNLDLNKRTTYATLGVSIITMFILSVQTFIQSKNPTVHIKTEASLTKNIEQELKELNTTLNLHHQTLKDSLKKELHTLTKK